MAKAKKAEGDEPVQSKAVHGVERVTNVLALLLVKDVKPQTEAIKLLDRAGFEPREIAALLGTSANGVSVALYQAKKQGKKKAKDRGKNQG